VTLTRQAFDYRNGKLTKIDWPFEEPGFDDFFDANALEGVPASHIENSKSDGSAFYLLNFGNGREVIVGAIWSSCDMYDFMDNGRIIEYRWNGASFDKKYHE